MQNSKLSLISKFEEIRDIPYHISVDGEKGFDCEDKAKMFAKWLNKHGFEARLRVGLFEWENVNLPDSVMSVDHDAGCSHMFVELKNSNGKWVFVDPTWNKELKKAGLPVAVWDGVNSTELAIVCDRILSPDDSQKYLEKIDYEADLRKNGEFYSAINHWCDSFLRFL